MTGGLEVVVDIALYFWGCYSGWVRDRWWGNNLFRSEVPGVIGQLASGGLKL
jgi:hypothetical protein